MRGAPCNSCTAVEIRSCIEAPVKTTGIYSPAFADVIWIPKVVQFWEGLVKIWVDKIPRFDLQGGFVKGHEGKPNSLIR